MKSSLISTQTHFTEIILSESEKIGLNFKSVDMREFLKMRALASRLVDCLTDLFSRTTEIPKQRLEIESDQITGREIRKISETEGISQEVLLAAADRKKRAVTSLLEIFMEEKYFDTTSSLIANSLRDEGYTKDDVKAADLAVYTQLLLGFLEANMGVLVPLMSRLGSLTGAPAAAATPATEGQ